MEAIAELNAIGASAFTGLPTRPVRALPIGENIPIRSVKRVTTRFGQRLLVTCPEFVVFLPERYAGISEATEAACNAGGLALVYLGEINGNNQLRFSPYKATS